uniref:Protein kinase domain-containing protein n=1 Tax=Helianthus annuus TaxID=4232 RepID=A0A251UN33_HELAN
MNSANYQHAMSRVTGLYGYIAPGKFFLLLSLNHELIIILTSGFSLLFITDQNSARLKQAKPISLCVTGSQSYGYCPLTWCTNVKSGGFTLQSNRNSDWETRYKIAVGSAQGLAYIHQDCVPAILHRDVKCNNILLDCKYEAYLVDFGLAKPMNSANYQHAMSRVTGSYGYIAPGKFFLLLSLNHELIIILTSGFKYGYTMNITEKSDVYSYRVVLLEIISGRNAVENRVREVSHIVEWVKKKMGSFEPTITILDAKLQAGVDLP